MLFFEGQVKVIFGCKINCFHYTGVNLSLNLIMFLAEPMLTSTHVVLTAQ